MHGVAERIENGCDIRIDGLVMPPDIGYGKRDIFRKRARPVHTYPLRMGAQMSPPGKAVAAAAADHVTFTAYGLSRAEINNVRADFHHLAYEFVPDHHPNRNGLPRPLIPFEDMDVGAADTGPRYPDENVIYADCRDSNVLQPEARFRFAFDKS